MDQLINDQWKFKKAHTGSTIEEAMEPDGWQDVDLPHDWLIWQENDLYESADAWYFREVELARDHLPVCLLRFDGVYMDCDIWINGSVICSHAYGYTAFTVDMSKAARSYPSPESEFQMVFRKRDIPRRDAYPSSRGAYRSL